MNKLRVRKLVLSSVAITDEHINGYENLEKVSISKKVQTLPKGAFYKKKKLRKVFIDPGSQLKVIPDHCFAFCDSIQEFVLPDSIVSIEEKAFAGCKNISQIEIKQNITYVHPSAFDGWKQDQRIFFYRKYEFSEKCKAKLIDISEEKPTIEKVIAKESDLSLKKYIVKAKCGHVGRHKYIPISFPIEATSKKEAARMARLIPRVKHDHTDAILECRAVSETEFHEQVNINKNDLYLKITSKHEQKEVLDIIKPRLIDEPNYTRRKK